MIFLLKRLKKVERETNDQGQEPQRVTGSCQGIVTSILCPSAFLALVSVCGAHACACAHVCARARACVCLCLCVSLLLQEGLFEG